MRLIMAGFSAAGKFRLYAKGFEPAADTPGKNGENARMLRRIVTFAKYLDVHAVQRSLIACDARKRPTQTPNSSEN
ncbi:hypothetical protein BV914_05965 [Neisseria dumasiana]|nr:hypothetical protein BV914_05965 [Neisseria dumasiana]